MKRIKFDGDFYDLIVGVIIYPLFTFMVLESAYIIIALILLLFNVDIFTPLNSLK